MLEEQRVRGILITQVHGSAPAIKGIRDRGTPVVLLDRPGPPGHCSVAVDDRRGAYHAVIRAGLDPAAVLTEISVPAMNTPCGAQAADEIRAPGRYGPGVPTAAFCTNDLLALGLLRRLSQLGAQVPGDLAIVGYDDIDFAADSAVPLTSIRQPKYELGQTAAQLILEEADAPAEHEHRRFVFTPELVTRASSQPGASSADATN